MWRLIALYSKSKLDETGFRTQDLNSIRRAGVEPFLLHCLPRPQPGILVPSGSMRKKCNDTTLVFICQTVYFFIAEQNNLHERVENEPVRM